MKTPDFYIINYNHIPNVLVHHRHEPVEIFVCLLRPPSGGHRRRITPRGIPGVRPRTSGESITNGKQDQPGDRVPGDGKMNETENENDRTGRNAVLADRPVWIGRSINEPEMVPPSPRLAEKMKTDLAQLRAKAKGPLSRMLAVRDYSPPGKDDGLIYPGDLFPLGTSAEPVRRAAADRAPITDDPGTSYRRVPRQKVCGTRHRTSSSPGVPRTATRILYRSRTVGDRW